MSVSARVKQLEKATSGGGELVVVYLCHDDYAPFTAQEEATALAAAHVAAGPGGDVLTVRYTQDWREGERVTA